MGPFSPRCMVNYYSAPCEPTNQRMQCTNETNQRDRDTHGTQRVLLLSTLGTVRTAHAEHIYTGAHAANSARGRNLEFRQWEVHFFNCTVREVPHIGAKGSENPFQLGLIYCTTSHRHITWVFPSHAAPFPSSTSSHAILFSILRLFLSPYSYGLFIPRSVSRSFSPPPSLFPIPTVERKMHTRCPTSTRSLQLYVRSLYDGAQRHKGADLSYPALPTAGSGSQGRVVVEKRRVANAHLLLFVEGGRGQASSLGLFPLFLPPFLGRITST